MDHHILQKDFVTNALKKNKRLTKAKAIAQWRSLYGTKKPKRHIGGNDEQECPICSKNVYDGINSLKCMTCKNEIYHIACIVKALQSNTLVQACPTCRGIMIPLNDTKLPLFNTIHIKSENAHIVIKIMKDLLIKYKDITRTTALIIALASHNEDTKNDIPWIVEMIYIFSIIKTGDSLEMKFDVITVYNTFLMIFNNTTLKVQELENELKELNYKLEDEDKIAIELSYELKIKDYFINRLVTVSWIHRTVLYKNNSRKLINNAINYIEKNATNFDNSTTIIATLHSIIFRMINIYGVHN